MLSLLFNLMLCVKFLSCFAFCIFVVSVICIIYVDIVANVIVVIIVIRCCYLANVIAPVVSYVADMIVFAVIII